MSIRKSGFFFSLAVAVILNFGNRAFAATGVVFKDSWSDSVSNNTVVTTGSFSTTISVPFDDSINALDIDSNSVFTLSIGPSGATPLIAENAFGNAANFSQSGKSATFELLDASTLVAVGTLNVTWTATTITATGTAPADILGEDILLQAGSTHSGASTNLGTSSTGKYFEVVLTVDASDNGGGIFTYDNPYLQVSGNNQETLSSSVSLPLESGSVSGTLVSTNSVTIIVNPTGAGKITGLRTGQVLQSGKKYSVTATAASKQYIFSDWTDGSGNVVATNATYSFTDNFGSGANFAPEELIANFATNPFYNSDLTGTYAGLFYSSDNVLNQSNAGYISITVAPSGAYSGRLYLSTSPAAHPISGQLRLGGGGSYGSSTTTVSLGKSNSLSVYLQVATDTNFTDTGAGKLTGYVIATYGGTSSTSAIDAQISAVKTNFVAGLYNIVLTPVSTDPATGPGGYSYGTATVTKKGTVTYSFHLADGISTVTFASSIYQNGESPIYASLYGGKGLLFGWLDFSTASNGLITQSSLTWTKQPVKDLYYTNGFTAYPEIAGQLYVAPKTGTNVFGSTNLTLDVDTNYAGLALPDAFEVPIAFNPARNTFTASTNTVKTTWSPSTGAISGSFVDAVLAKAPFAFRGVVVNGVAYGSYTDVAVRQTGPVTLGVPGGTNGIQFTGGQ